MEIFSAGIISGVIGIGKSLIDLATGTKKNKEEIKELRKEMNELVKDNIRMSLELKQLKENGERDRQNLILELENQLLRFQNQLPPKKDE